MLILDILDEQYVLVIDIFDVQYILVCVRL
jgi:hypothetical protein